MEEKKVYKTVIIGVIIYVIVMLAIFLPKYISDRRDNLYILSGEFIKIKYSGGNWSNIEDSDDYKLKEFEVYESDNYKGKYKILYTNKFYLYDSNGKNTSYEGQLFAYTGSLKLSVVTDMITEISESDKVIIQKVLDKLNINEYKNLNTFQKVSLDTDKDGITENIYSISNYYTEDSLDKVFSIVFTEENGNINILKEKVISADKIYEEPSYEINKVIDIKDDKKYEIMIEQSYYSRPMESCILLYKLHDKQNLIADLCE